MTDALQRLRAKTVEDVAFAEAEVTRLQDRLGIFKHYLSRIDAEIEASGDPESELPSAAEPRREKRDIRGAALAVFVERGVPLSLPMLRGLLEQQIGDLAESALARSLSSLVGDGKVIERDGVFSLPPQPAPPPAVSRLDIGFLSGEQAAK
jgi:hypothetical protein